MKKRVTILGGTGSVGLNTLEVIRENPDKFEVSGLAARSKIDDVERFANEFGIKRVFLEEDKGAAELTRRLAGKAKVFSGKTGLLEFTRSHDFDILVAASSGTSGLLPVIEALEKGRRVALSNKEILVMAGDSVMERARRVKGAEILPVDSEHSAIFQCLLGDRPSGVKRLVLTSSGGPLRDVPQERFAGIPKETVINHPRWKMGPKISVDSATLMNKGLEVVEAAWLFGVAVDDIDVVIHPEAIVHSMVEYKDGAMIAQLGVTDMKLPIQYALGFPDRLPCPESRRLDLAKMEALRFFAPDRRKFPCLDLAYEAARRSGSAPCVLGAADEVAVGAFLEDRIDFTEIPRIIESVLSRHNHVSAPDLDQIRTIHEWATEETRRLCTTR